MSGSQVFSSVLCIGVLCSVANGFSPIVKPGVATDSRSSTGTPIILPRDPYSRMQSRTGRQNTNLRATKGRSKAPDTAIASKSEKVLEMASFLSIQLLEKVMSEAMKPEGERTMDLEAIERVTQALQKTSELPSDVTMTTTTELTSEVDDIGLSGGEATTIEPEEAPEPTLSTSSVVTETKPEPSSLPTTSESDKTDLESKEVEEKTETIPEVAVKEEKPPTPTPKAVVPTPKEPEIVRKPLEVIQSDIPPLRPESIPQRTNPIAEDEPEEETATIQEEIVGKTPDDEKEDNSEENPSSEGAVAEESSTLDECEEDEALVLERKKAEESFRRQLLKQKLEYDQKKASRIESESQADSEPPASTDEAKEDTQKGESTISDLVSEPCDEEEPEPPTLTFQRSSPSSPPVISQRRVETILARRQPKVSEEESKLAEKYSQMTNLEDRAYALLMDLGMIDEHKDPRDPSYDHSKDDELCDGQRFFPKL